MENDQDVVDVINSLEFCATDYNAVKRSSWRSCEYDCGLRLCRFKMQEHKNICPARPYDYLCKICDEKFLGSYNFINVDFKTHILQAHMNNIVFLPDTDDWSFPMTYADETKIVIRNDIDYYKNEYFWVTQKIEDGRRKIMIQQFFATDEFHSLSVFEIKSHESKLVFQAEVIPRNTHPVDFSSDAIDVTKISACGTLTIKFVGLVTIPEEILLLLECLICNCLMTGKIVLCTTGHSVCHSCLSQITSCPLCQQSFLTDQRNYLAESIIESSNKICENRRNGCQEQFSAQDRNLHLKICMFASLNCPKCYNEMNYYQLYNHMLNECGNSMSRITYEMNNLISLASKPEIAFFSKYGKDFILDFSYYEDQMFLAVRQITRNDSDLFYYEVKLFNAAKNNHRQAELIGKCHQLNDEYPLNITSYTYCKVRVFKLPQMES
ncbi:uncharacterized protein LOC113384724 [Ctenocephalides felis]|uniref:uncharacterized protein LOC113384724 n=1 Tax=Ctenocephalides felis TaxID=7515 RepID=UPI000E6E500E|nr:uncharacterized protein LOC113384724 [Ctenocephalides felis]